MRYAEVCTGAGGLSIGLEAAGFSPAWFAEIEPHASAVLAKRWPDVPNHGDWTAENMPRKAWDCELDLLAGGIPCQSHSHAGKRKGADDERNLWPAFKALTEALAPPVVLVENVPGLLTSDEGLFFLGMLEDLRALGYVVEWDHVPACAMVDEHGLRAPHRRDRVFVIARRDGLRTWPEDGVPVPWQDELFPTRRRWPRAGRFDARGQLWQREPRWPVFVGEWKAWPTPSRQDQASSGAACYSTESGRHSGTTLTDAIERLTPSDVVALPWATANLSPANVVNSSNGVAHEREETDADQVLRAVRAEVGEEAFWRAAGGAAQLQEAALLFATLLRPRLSEGPPNRWRVTQACLKAPEATLRALRYHREAGDSPQGREQRERIARELADALCLLPHTAPLGDGQDDEAAHADRLPGLREGRREDEARALRTPLPAMENARRSAVAQATATGRSTGRLNPDFIESLMAWPVGHTDLDCDEPEQRPHPAPMLEVDGETARAWSTASAFVREGDVAAQVERKPESTRAEWGDDLSEQVARSSDRVCLYGASPQYPHEPPRLTERTDQRRKRLAAIGNGVHRLVGLTIAKALRDSLDL